VTSAVLAEFGNLEFLNLNEHRVSNLGPLAELKNLSTLFAQRHRRCLTSFPLAGLTKLEWVESRRHGGCPDLRPLAAPYQASPAASSLAGTRVSDLVPLAGALMVSSGLASANTRVS